MNKRIALVMSLFVTLLLGGAVVVNSTFATPQTAGAAQGNSTSVYLPFITTPPLLDLAVTDLEVTQSVQTPINNVPLVAQRHALVRVYAQTLVGTSPDNVVVTLQGIRNGVSLGVLSANPRPIPTNPTRADFSSTVNFLLPVDWRTGNVSLVARVNVNDDDPNNNMRQHTATFNPVPQLRVVVVPIHYNHQGPTNPGVYPPQSVDYISSWIQRAFPVPNVQITIRSPHAFSGNLQTENSWLILLDQMLTLKVADGYSPNTPVFYYGFIPINNGSSQWFSSGIAGIGWISPSGEAWRESLGLNLGQNDNTGILAGHEIGHNMGRRHAPCGNPAGVDPSYPYGGASIGQFGYDIGHNALRNPATYLDMMSYCSPEWISDYTYNALFVDQTIKGNWPDQGQTFNQQLLIRASLDEAGGVAMRPVYQFEMSENLYPASPATLYAVQLLDEAGAVIVQHPISLREAEEPGIVARSFMGTVPLPEVPVASLQLVSLAGESTYVLAGHTLTGRDLAARTDSSLIETADSLHLTWSDSNRPAIVRYTGDDGATWTTLAVDHLGGELVVDKEWLEGLSLHERDNGRFEIILANGTNANVLTLEK